MSAVATQSNGRVSLDDYIDVAERIANFNEKYPEGSLQTIEWSAEVIGERLFIVYRAAAYRTPDDLRPGQGIAWEPFPGRTPYTRDSELMNAETAAWGRAIVACGLTSNRKIASRQEVQARQGEPEQNGGTGATSQSTSQPTAAPPKQSERRVTANQRTKLLEPRAQAAGLSAGEFANVILKAAGKPPREWRNAEHAEHTLDRLLEQLPARLKDAVLEGIAAAADGGTER